MPLIRTLVDYPVVGRPPKGSELEVLGEESEGSVLVEYKGGQFELPEGHWEWVGSEPVEVRISEGGLSELPVWLL